MFKTSYLLPTARDRYKEVMRTWDMENCEFLISYEVSNPSLSRLTEEEKKTYKGSIIEFEHNAPLQGIVYAWNMLANNSSGQAIQVIADDLWNTNTNWRELVLEVVPDFLENPWVVIANDNWRTFDSGLAAHPLLSRPYYELFGYVWYPEYKAYGCDNELYDVSNRLHRLAFIEKWVHENRHAGCWPGENADEWSQVVQATSDQALTVWNNKNRIDKLILQKEKELKRILK